MNQRTLARETDPLQGQGVHSGQPTRIVCRPAPANSGLRFRRGEKDSNAPLPADLAFVSREDSLRRTTLQHPDGWSVQTPEHLLSACVALGITNLDIHIDGSEEVPILDGSAHPFAAALEKAGMMEQAEAPAALWTVPRPVLFRQGEAEIAVIPSAEMLTVACFIEFPETVVGSQSVVMHLDPETYLREIAPARTFVLESDVAALRADGLIQGGNLEIAVVIGRDRYLNPPLRFPDECVRHKVIDLLGDLALIGGLPRGHFMAYRAGHASHLAFGHYLRKEELIQWIQPPPTSLPR